MRVSEIFYSIQGEGSLIGIPSVFVRTCGCNLRCTWCDTPYTSWNPDGEDLSLDEIETAITRFRASHVVLTGGEPMIAPQIGELVGRLHAAGFHITIETAGTIYLSLHCNLMSISPKLSNSTPRDRDGGRWAAHHERLRFQPDVIRRLTSAYPFQLKFVVSSPGDLAEIEVVRETCEAPSSSIILMPEGIDREILRERAVWLAEICKEKGYRLSPRLHIDLWGDRRGV